MGCSVHGKGGGWARELEQTQAAFATGASSGGSGCRNGGGGWEGGGEVRGNKQAIARALV